MFYSKFSIFLQIFEICKMVSNVAKCTDSGRNTPYPSLQNLQTFEIRKTGNRIKLSVIFIQI